MNKRNNAAMLQLLEPIVFYNWIIYGIVSTAKFAIDSQSLQIMIMIIFIHKKETLQIMSTNKQQSPNLRIPVENYKIN